MVAQSGRQPGCASSSDGNAESGAEVPVEASCRETRATERTASGSRASIATLPRRTRPPSGIRPRYHDPGSVPAAAENATGASRCRSRAFTSGRAASHSLVSSPARSGFSITRPSVVQARTTATGRPCSTPTERDSREATAISLAGTLGACSSTRGTVASRTRTAGSVDTGRDQERPASPSSKATRPTSRPAMGKSVRTRSSTRRRRPGSSMRDA